MTDSDNPRTTARNRFDPQIQTLPLRTESGRQIRDAFTNQPVGLLIDWLGLELRLLQLFTKK